MLCLFLFFCKGLVIADFGFSQFIDSPHEDIATVLKP